MCFLSRGMRELDGPGPWRLPRHPSGWSAAALWCCPAGRGVSSQWEHAYRWSPFLNNTNKKRTVAICHLKLNKTRHWLARKGNQSKCGIKTKAWFQTEQHVWAGEWNRSETQLQYNFSLQSKIPSFLFFLLSWCECLVSPLPKSRFIH